MMKSLEPNELEGFYKALLKGEFDTVDQAIKLESALTYKDRLFLLLMANMAKMLQSIEKKTHTD